MKIKKVWEEEKKNPGRKQDFQDQCLRLSRCYAIKEAFLFLFFGFCFGFGFKPFIWSYNVSDSGKWDANWRELECYARVDNEKQKWK